MWLFDEQINIRREQERKSLWTAFENLAAGVSGERRNLFQKEVGTNETYLRLLRLLGDHETALSDDPELWQDQFELALRHNHIMYRKVKLTYGWWRDTCGYLLGKLVTGETIVMQPRKWAGYFYTDPATGRQVKVNRRTARAISSEAYCFYPPFADGEIDVKQMARFVFQRLDFADWAFVATAFLVVTLFGMLTPYITKLLFDSVIPSADTRDIMPIAFLLAGAGVGVSLFTVSRNLVLERVKNKIDIYAEAAIMGRVFNLPVNFFRNYNSGDLANRVLGFSSLCTLLTDQCVVSSLTAIFYLAFVVQMVHYASALVLPGVIIILLSILLILLNFVLGVSYRRQRAETSSQLMGVVFGILNGVQKIKLAGAEIRIFAKWSELFSKNARLSSHPPVYFRMNAALSTLCATGGMLYLYYSAYTERVGMADYMAFNAAFGMVSFAFTSLFSIIPTLQQIQPVWQLVSPVLTSPTETSDDLPQVTSLTGAVELMNVTFRYHPDGPPVIDNLSLSVSPGEYVGIVGVSGCGKSTLLRLLIGFEKPESGVVLYDNYDVDKIDKPSLRRLIGTCLQDGKLFTGDVFSNITVTAPWSSREDAWEAARMAACDDDIRKMPMEMNTVVSEGGANFSGGQRQRMLIARAIIGKPAILLMDEATNALDNTKQDIVTRNLDKMGCTRIVIAHRLSTIRNCHRIVVLDKGRIAEQGTFAELMEKRGLFYELSRQQL